MVGDPSGAPDGPSSRVTRIGPSVLTTRTEVERPSSHPVGGSASSAARAPSGAAPRGGLHTVGDELVGRGPRLVVVERDQPVEGGRHRTERHGDGSPGSATSSPTERDRAARSVVRRAPTR